MDLNVVYNDSCENALKYIDRGSVDLIITSPPYADLRKYGHKNSQAAPDKYLEWFLPKAKVFFDVLKDTGSFILNINDCVVDRFRHPYVYELVVALEKEVGFKRFETLHWDKGCSPPGSNRRFRDTQEYIFWFAKSKDFRLNMDSGRVPYDEKTISRYKLPNSRYHTRDSSKEVCPECGNQMRYKKDRLKCYKCHYEEVVPLKKVELHPMGALPSNVITMGSEANNQGYHTAVFPLSLPKYLIPIATNKGDVVYDPFMGCYSDDIEILTNNGWKFFDELLKKDRPITRDENGNIHYQDITEFHKYKYDGEMVRISTRSMDLLVTPNHNMFVKTHNDFLKKRKERLIQAKDLKNVLYRVPVGGKYKPEHETLTREQMFLIGLYVSEGYLSNRRSRGKDRIFICQNKGVKWDRFCDNLTSHKVSTSGDRRIVVYITEDFYDFILQNCGESKYKKHLSPLILSNKHLSSLFEAMVLGDGTVSKTGQTRYYTVSKRLSNDFQELSLKLGFGTSVRERSNSRMDRFEREIIKSTVPCYDIGIRKSNYQKIIPQRHVSLVPYSGNVYCVTVPNHVLYVRRNGYSVWCGNSGTTALACLDLNRKYIGTEIVNTSKKPIYDECLKRIEKYRGLFKTGYRSKERTPSLF